MSAAYMIDIDAVINYVFDGQEKENQTDIVDMYGYNEKGKFELLNKQISETKNVLNDSKSTIKYDFVKNIFNLITDIEDFETIGVSEQMAFNGLLNKGFIKEVNDNTNG